MSQHALGVNLCCSLLPVHLSRCKTGTIPLLSTELHQRKKESAHSLLNGRHSIMFYSLHKILHVIIGSQKHECFVCYLLNHTCCPNTRATQKQHKKGIKVFHTKTYLFSEVLLKLTLTHLPLLLKGSGEKETERKQKRKRKGCKTCLRCIAGKEIKSTHSGLRLLEIQGSVLSPSFMPGQSDGGTEHLL